MEKAATGFEVNEARHFTVVDDGHIQSTGDADAIHDVLVVGGLAEDIGGDGAGDGVRVNPEFSDRFLKIPDDRDDALGGLLTDFAFAENVPCECGGLFEEIDDVEFALPIALSDHQ